MFAVAAGEIGAIPFTAWEQAVFVVLLIVVIVILLNWQSRQQGSWQEFIQKRDQQWQDWMKETNTDTTNAMEKVTEALEKLSMKIDDHDERVELRVQNAVNDIKGMRKKS